MLAKRGIHSSVASSFSRLLLNLVSVRTSYSHIDDVIEAIMHVSRLPREELTVDVRLMTMKALTRASMIKGARLSLAYAGAVSAVGALLLGSAWKEEKDPVAAAAKLKILLLEAEAEGLQGSQQVVVSSAFVLAAMSASHESCVKMLENKCIVPLAAVLLAFKNDLPQDDEHRSALVITTLANLANSAVGRARLAGAGMVRHIISMADSGSGPATAASINAYVSLTTSCAYICHSHADDALAVLTV